MIAPSQYCISHCNCDFADIMQRDVYVDRSMDERYKISAHANIQLYHFRHFMHQMKDLGMVSLLAYYSNSDRQANKC